MIFFSLYSHKTLEIARNRFFAIREKIRQKYANWNEFVLPLGRLSEFSSLRKLQMEKYRMQEVLIDRKCAAPRFVIKPQSTFALEGHSARFTCRIIRYVHILFNTFFISILSLFTYIFLFSVWLLALYHGIITMWNWNRVLNIWNVTLVMTIPLSSIVLRLEKEEKNYICVSCFFNFS